MHFKHDELYRTCSIIVFLVTCILGSCLVSSAELSSSSGSIISIDALANDITSDFGSVSDSSIGSTDKNVFVFQETHTSRAVQIEIAIMLNRLHNNGLKIIALEGLNEGENLDTQWLQKISDNEAKKQIAVQLLEKGEISNAEFIAICYPDVEVIGVEKPEYYNVDLSGDAASSAMYYLIAIAEKSMTQDQIEDANKLAEAGQIEEYVEFIVNSDGWTKEQYEKLYGEASSTDSIEEKIILLDDIKKKADESGASVDSDIEKDFSELQNFYEAASKRSETIAANTLDASKRSPNAPVALIIGAAHTPKVSSLLKEGDASYVTISTESFDKADDPSELDPYAFVRKIDRLSVDENGLLGSFLDNRPDTSEDSAKKPPSILGEVFLQSEYQIYYAATLIAHDAKSSGFPTDDLKNELEGLDQVKVDLPSIKLIDQDVTFTSEVKDQEGKWLTVYTRVLSADTQVLDIEKLLKDALAEVQKTEKNPEKLVKVSSGVLAKFSQEPIREAI